MTARGLARKLFLLSVKHTEKTQKNKNTFFYFKHKFFLDFFSSFTCCLNQPIKHHSIIISNNLFPSFFSVFLLLHDLGFWNSKTISLRCFYSLQKATFSFWSCFFSPLEKCKILISLYYYYSYFVTRNLRRVLPITALLSFFNFFNQATSGVSVIFKEKYAYNNSAPEEAKYAPPPLTPDLTGETTAFPAIKNK